MKRIVVLHLHFEDTWEDFVQAIENICPNEILITTTLTEKIDLIILKRFPHAKIFHLENRGRDIYPLIYLAKRNYFSSQAIVWKLHSKKSTHLLKGNNWRKRLIRSLSSPSRIIEIMEIFSDGRTSMVGDFNSMKMISKETIAEHLDLYTKWSIDLGVDIRQFDNFYFVGTFFVVKSNVLDDLKNLNLDINNFLLERKYNNFSKTFALKLYLLNFFRSYGLFTTSYMKLDKSTRPASQETYAMEAFLGFMAKKFGEIRGI